MPERTLEQRYRLLAAAFRDDAASAAARERASGGFQEALELIVGALGRDVAAAPRDLDGEKVGWMVRTVLPARLVGNESWRGAVPDVAESFLRYIAEAEGVPSAWEWVTAVDAARDAYAAALRDPDRERLGAVAFKPDRRPAAKIGRNDPCPCGSGRKYKQCCLKLLP